MPKREAVLFVHYCAKDFLDGANELSPWEELAYRRICDLIYATNDRLADDDKKLAWQTKCGRRWRAIKAALTGGPKPKLLIVDGRITNQRCQAELQKAVQKMCQIRQATGASVASGKSLKNLKQNRTGVRSPAPNGTPNELTNQESEEERDPKGSWSNGPEGGRSTETDTGVEEAAKEEVRDPDRGPSKAEVEGEFREAFWPECPRKVGKQEALRQYRIARRSVSMETLVDGMRHYSDRVAGTDPHFMVHPERWLSKQRWLDEEPAVQVWGYRNGRRSAHNAETAAFEAITRQ